MNRLLRSQGVTTLIAAAVLLAFSVAPSSAEEEKNSASKAPAKAEGPITVERVRAGVEKYIRTKFKESKNLNIKLVPFEDPAQLQKGRLRQITITLDRGIFEGIAMENLYMSGRDVIIQLDALFTLNKLRTTQREHGQMRATITEADLDSAFQSVKMPIRDFHIQFAGNGVVATGTYKFIVGNKLKMRATLEPKPDGVWFVCQRASVNGLALPAGQVRALLNKMNPIIDFTSLPFSPKVRVIKIDAKKKVLSIE